MSESVVIKKKTRAVFRENIDSYSEKISDLLAEENTDSFELELTLEQLEETASELKKIELEIQSLIKEEHLDAEIKTADEYRQRIVSCRFKAKRKLRSLNQNQESSDQSTKQNQLNVGKDVNIKLPKIQISKFSGDLNEWLAFWSVFQKTIHENEKLDTIDKLNYLKSYLSGEALLTIEGFSITKENYSVCVDLLTERYGRKEILIDKHLNNILNLQPVKSSHDVKSLRKLYDLIQIQIRSLESLDVNISTYGNLLSPILLKLFPKDLIFEFHKQTRNESYSTKDLITFLYNQITALESLNQNESYKSFNRPERNSHAAAGRDAGSHRSFNAIARQSGAAKTLFVDSRISKEKREECSFCLCLSHDSNSCPEIINLPFHEKLIILKKKGICYRCLRIASHIGKNCTTKIFCLKCKLPHSSIMCNRSVGQRGEYNQTRAKEKAEVNGDVSGTTNQSLANNAERTNTYLQTLVAHIRSDNSGALIRVIVDSGSENSYLSKYVAGKLNLKKIRSERIRHGLFGGMEFSETHSRYRFTLSSLDKSFNCSIEAFDQDKICTGVNCVSDKNLITALNNNKVYLSDIYENRELCLYEKNPEEIHLLLGSDFAGQIFTRNVKYLQNLGLSAFGTKLGWVIMGKDKSNKISEKSENSISTLSISMHVSSNLENLWSLDTLGILDEENKTKIELQEETKKYFLETVKRDDSGRYEISLPWVVDPAILPSNKKLAESTLFRTERKLSDSGKQKEYTDIFKFWESDQIIEEVADKKTERTHFLPHRPVIKESSETTKMRPVFNASAHERNLPSLNDCLTKGPNLIEIIPSILNRFRKYQIGISSDIEKAFLQIKVAEKDRDFLRFIWFDNERNLKVYRHCRVVFGLTSSPFLLVATVKHLLSQVPPIYADTARILENSFYIDNSLVSLNSESEIEKFKSESISILASGHFNLRCWRSNLPSVMSEETEEKPKTTPVLGLVWELENDKFMCKLDEKIKIEQSCTKRKILSITQKIFDPIGFTTPVVLIPKFILQQTWILKLKWDQELPEDLTRQFINWLKDIKLLPQIKIPRWLNVDVENENRVTLHIFSDASKIAYATCAFLRVETSEGIKIQLVNARSRVSPLKELTIPRLELLSCLIGVRIARTISIDLDLGNVRKIFWSDSTTALGWIRREQSWGTYVHNRVLEIRKLSQVSDWRHVPGLLNPADLPSRGCSFQQLKESNWWEGPSWLYAPENTWPLEEESPNEELINSERKKGVLTLIERNNPEDWYWYYRYFSSYNKIVRMIAWINRFLYNARNATRILDSNISVEELEKAEKVVLKLIQRECLISKADSKLKGLRPLEDRDGIVRTKTNIVNRDDTEDFLYPVVLPSQHPVVKRLILEKHLEHHHAGVGALTSILREKYWIMKARKCIRSVLRECVKCRRFEASRIEVEPGIPPEDRVRDAAVFEVVGTDVAGPLYLSNGAKTWIVLFTCAVYRAVHLELISSLSTDSFLQALRRFISRRGRPHTVYSDNGTNYVGTANALSNLNWHKIVKETSVQKIRWKFSPPAAPWWGGWWERLVRIVKDILRKMLGRASLNYEELNTILCDCECVINSRPITYVSEDSNDLSPLTPRMFLQELPTSGIPDLDTLDSKSLNRRARFRQRIRNDLRKRFRNEYLGQLRQQRQKKESSIQLKVGDIVLLEDASGKRINWPLARIVQLLPGRDGIARLCRVQTQSGTFLRPVQRLFPLEISSSSPSGVLDSVRSETASVTSPTDSVSVPEHEPNFPVVTRSGREVKTPQRFRPS